MEPPLPTSPSSFDGFYFDGRTASRQAVRVTVTPGGLLIAKADGSTLWWLYEHVRQTQGSHPGEPIRLEKGDGIAEALVVHGEGFLGSIQQIAPGDSARFQRPARRAMWFSRIAIAAAGAVLFAAAFYFWGIPAVTEAAASYVPVSWEERLGSTVVAQLAPEEKQCRDAERTQLLEQILAALLAPQPPSPYQFTVTVVEDATANAFALPGGRIVLYHGLLLKAQSAGELAGVLAHEIEHIRQRHSLKALFRELSLRALLAILTGSGTNPALEAAGAVGSLRYQRADEEAADAEGMKMVQAAQIDPLGIVRLMGRLDEDAAAAPAGFEYLSSHPLTQNRVDRLRELAGQAHYTPIPLLPNYSWDDMQKICDAKR